MNLPLAAPVISPAAAAAQAPAVRRGDDPVALRQACREFEALFVQMLFQEMRSTVPAGGVLGGGAGEEIFRGLMDAELARQAARGQGFGIGESLFRQLQGEPPAAGARPAR